MDLLFTPSVSSSERVAHTLVFRSHSVAGSHVDACASPSTRPIRCVSSLRERAPPQVGLALAGGCAALLGPHLELDDETIEDLLGREAVER